MEILSVYRLSLENKTKETQVLSRFNGESDFFQIVNEFCNYTFQKIHNYIDNSGRQRSFSLARPPMVNVEERYIVGVFEPGFTGERFKIKDGITNSLKFNVQKRDLQSRELFTLIYVPKNSNYAYLCIQKRENFSIKTVIESTLNLFLNESGYLDFRLNIENAPDYNYLKRMIYQGDLKEIRLINEKGLVFDEDLYMDALRNVRVDRDEHVLKIGKSSSPTIIKNELARVFYKNYLESEKIYFLGNNQGYDEVSFVLSLDNITKTFYVKDKSRIRSNMDITKLVETENGEIIMNSVVEACLFCIRNIDSSSGDLNNVA